MRFELSTAPAYEPLTIADVEAHLQLGTIPEDQGLAVSRYIAAARRWVENRLHRQIITATWKAYLDYLPDEIIIYDKLPITGITSIQYVDLAGTTQTVSSADYQVDVKSKHRPARIMPAYGKTWPLVRSDTYNAVTITFTAGYGTRADVPDTIKNAMLLLVGDWYKFRESSFLGSGSATQIPFGVDACLAGDEWGAYS